MTTNESDARLARWARVALLSLQGEVLPCDLDAARHRLRLIIDALETRPAAPKDITRTDMIKLLKEHGADWFIDHRDRLVMLIECHSADDNDGPSHGWFTELVPITSVEQARDELGY